MAWFLSAVRNSWRDDRGVVAVFTVLMLPILIGALALAVDIGFWYVTKRNVQNAADAAAIAVCHLRHSRMKKIVILDRIGGRSSSRRRA